MQLGGELDELKTGLDAALEEWAETEARLDALSATTLRGV